MVHLCRLETCICDLINFIGLNRLHTCSSKQELWSMELRAKPKAKSLHSEFKWSTGTSKDSRWHTQLNIQWTYQLLFRADFVAIYNPDKRHAYFNPSCTKVFATHTYYQGGGGGEGLRRSPMISKTVDSTSFNFGKPLRLSRRGESGRVDDLSLVRFSWQLICVRVFQPNFAEKKTENDHFETIFQVCPSLSPTF